MRTPVTSRFLPAFALLLISSTTALAQQVTSYAFVPNVDSNTVSVVDTTTNAVVATVPVGIGPRSTAVSPDARRVYVANRTDNTISVIDTATRAVIGSPIPVGVMPHSIAITPDCRKAYIGNLTAGEVVALDLTTNAVAATIVTPALADPNGPADIVITPDGATVWVVAYRSGIVPIDVATDTAGAMIPIGPSTMSVAIHGQTAWVGHDDAIAVVDLSSQTVTDTIVTNHGVHRDLAFSPDGATVYAVSPENNVVTVIDTATRSVVATIAVGNTPAAVAFEPNGSYAYVTNEASNNVSVIDTSNLTVATTIPVGVTPGGSGGSFISPNIIDLGQSLSISSDADFDAHHFGSFIPMRYGRIVATADWTTTRTFSMLAPNGAIDTNGFNVTLDGGVINDGQLIKEGAGTLTLSGTSTNAGGTQSNIDGGTLIVNGTHTGGPLYVGWDAMLRGTGTVGDLQTNVGTIAPGGPASGSTGILSAANVTLWSLANVNIDIKGALPGSGHDQLLVSGTAALENAFLNLDSSGYSPSPGQQFTIVTNTSGSFRTAPEGWAIFDVSGNAFRVTYKGGDGNDLVLTADVEAPQVAGFNGLHVSIDEDAGPVSVPFTLSDDAFQGSEIETEVFHSSKPELVPLSNMSIAGTGASRTVQFTPVPNATGSVVLHIRAIDGAHRSVSTGFGVTVNPVNDAPTISAIGSQSIPENTPLDPVAFTVGDIDNDAGTLTVTATSSNQAVVPDANLTVGGSGAARTIAAMPRTGVRGDTTITLTVSDGSLTATTSFVLSVVERTYYLSEGATGAFFDTDILLANPNTVPAPVVIRFLTDNGQSIVQTRTLPPTSRTTIDAEEVSGLEATTFSTIVTSTDALPIVVERTMTWDASGYGAHTEKATAGAAPAWYFAEGAQGFFSTFFLLANPHAMTNTAHVTYFREGEPELVRDYLMEPGSRKTIDTGADPELIDRSFGARVTFDLPGVAERAMYFGRDPMWIGGHAAAGVTTPAASWFLAEGATGSYFTTFLLLANPNDDAANVTLTYFPESGVPVTKTETIPAHQRLTRNIAMEDASLASAAVATRIESTLPIVAERSQYWGTPAWIESHSSAGVTAAAPRWGLAEGRVGGPDGAQTYILLANPNTDPNATATVTITFLRADGAPLVKTFTVPPASRFNVGVTPSEASMAPELIDESFGALIESTQPIVVERSLYSNANGVTWAAGTNATATRLP